MPQLGKRRAQDAPNVDDDPQYACTVEQLAQEMQQGFEQTHQQLQNLRAKFKKCYIGLQNNSVARSMNAALPEDHALELVVDLCTNQAPDNFPATITDLKNLTGAQVNNLLAFYSLPTTGTVPTRRERLASFFGVRLQ